jgi:hypothetical protein
MRNASHGIEVYCAEELRHEQAAIPIMRYAFRPGAVSIRPMRVCFNCFVCKAGKLDDDFKKLFNFTHQQHARRKRIRLLECRD